MTPKTEAQESRFDLFKWLAVVALVVVGVVGNQYYSASQSCIASLHFSPWLLSQAL